jgi:hypothetical protein
MNHTTYISASNKMEILGQSKTSKRMREHAKTMAYKSIKKLKFDILVGEIREYKDAYFESFRLDKRPGDDNISPDKAWSMYMIFKSGKDNTHSIISHIDNNGNIKWDSGNKFMSRKSVNEFINLISLLSEFEEGFSKYFSHTKLNAKNLNVQNRTFYI